MKTVLITGGGGFLGGNLVHIPSPFEKTFVGFNYSPLSASLPVKQVHLDITDKNAVEKTIKMIRPNVIIHLAALTNSNFCAKNKNIADNVNIKGTENLVRAAEEVKARFVYTSTDLVFHGEREMYSEEDQPDPVCYYGATKHEAESVVSSLSSNFAIARCALAYGWSQNSSSCFTETMIQNLKEGKTINLFTDEYRTPVFVQDVCSTLFELATKGSKQGIYHLSGSERLNRFDFGIKLCRAFGFKSELLNPVLADDFSFVDGRPKDCSLNNGRTIKELKISFLSIEEGLNSMQHIF